MLEQYKEYTIVRLNAENIKHLPLLTKAVWGNSPDENIFYLKYYHPETEYSFLGYLAFDKEGNATGFQGAFRLSIAYKKEIKSIAQNTDFMTHPKHVGKGLSVYLGKKIYQLCKEKGMIGVIGYANQNSFPIVAEKLGFKVAEHLQAYRITIKTLPLEKISLKLSIIRKTYQTYRNLFFRKFKISYQIPYSFSKDEFPILQREGSLSDYKQANGAFCLQIENTTLWVKIKRDLFIGDLNCPTENEWLQVIKKLKQLCFWTGIRTIHFQSCKGSREVSYFEKHYPTYNSLPLCYLNFDDSIPLEKYKSTFGDIDIF